MFDGSFFRVLLRVLATLRHPVPMNLEHRCEIGEASQVIVKNRRANGANENRCGVFFNNAGNVY